MSRPKLLNQLKKKNSKLNRSDLEVVINTFCEDIERALKSEKKVEIRGFGTFFVKKIQENYSARNPKTGDLIYVPEKNKIRFRSSKNLKKLINE